MSISKIMPMAVASVCLSLTSFLATEAHPAAAVPLPLHHVVKLLPLYVHPSNSATTALLLKQALTKTRFATASSNVFLPGGRPLSGANAALYSQLKALATKSIYTSATTIGTINSGTTYSTVFTGFGPTLTPQPAEIDEFGRGNIFNNGGGTTITYNNSTGAVFNFSPVNTGVSGKILSTGAFGLAPLRTGSQATQAYNRLFSSVAAKGAQDGIYLQSHPIGGVLEGTYYYPSTYTPVYYQILAFGNSPLNNQALTSATFQQLGSYLQLAHNIRVPITNGQFLSTYYFRTSGNSFLGQAYNYDVFGKNPLNLGGNGPTLGASYPFNQPYFLF